MPVVCMRWTAAVAAPAVVRASRSCAWLSSANFEELHIENERCIRRNDSAGTARAVPQLGRNHELPPSAHLHARNSLVPALDDLARAERELERLVPVHAAVELGAIQKVAGVV